MTRPRLRHAEAARVANSPTDGWESERFRLMIAGGGIAALEALLALRALAGSRVDVDLLAPERDFVYRPLAVAEPFGRGTPGRVKLAEVAAAHGADHLVDALVSVDPERHTIRTSSGAQIEYSALLIAIGAQAVEAIPGALTYRGAADNEAFGNILHDLAEGRTKRLTFAVPTRVRWSLPLYELALMTAAHLSRSRAEGTELVLVTPEVEPLIGFGSRASASVRRLLEGAGVRLLTASVPTSAHDGELTLVGGKAVAADHVVALPELEVPPIPGLPQDQGGFIRTDSQMKVKGTVDVYAAGDATAFAIKQGGLAAQQADVAAASIAARAGAPAPHEEFHPVLRAALLTGSTPHYLRADADTRPASSTEAERPLWWPPSKVAGRYLAPYLVAGRAGEPSEPLADLEPVLGEDTEAAADHADAVGLALSAADADARWGDYDAALRWLGVAEQLDLVLPPEYEQKRRLWSRR